MAVATRSEPIRLRPTEMTTFDEEGNCFEACLASMLGLDIDVVPRQPPGQDDGPALAKYMFGDLNEWLASLGWQALTLPVLEFDPEAGGLPDSHWIAFVSVPFTDRWHHAVIARGTEIVWDPDPRGKCPGITPDNLKQMMWLVPLAA
jgi:hypothetical protein